MLMKIEVFHMSFEKRYLDTTREFYCQAADRPPQLRDFVEFVGSAMSFERQFVADVGFPTSTWKIEDHDILRAELVLNRLPRMIQGGLGDLMNAADTTTLRSLYSLCQLVPDKLVIESVFRFSLQEAVAQICTRAVSSIDEIIHTQQKIKRILSESFDDRISFHGAYKDAMESVLNGPNNAAIPSMLAAWSDKQLYKSIDSENVEMTDAHIWMDQMVGVFKLLNSKDVFEVHYRSFLSKRLLLISSNFGSMGHLINYETAAVNLLKQECGAGYTNKLESMIRDVAVSEEISRDDALYGQQSLARVQLRVTVATTGVWPLTAWAERVKVPHAIHDMEISFMKRYMDKNPKKSLKFVHAMTSAIVKFKRKEFVCSAAQALILCLLNDSDSVDKTFVLSETSLPEVEASKALSTLEESGLLVQQDEIYSVNAQFKMPSSGQVVLNQYQYRRVGAEPELTDEERAQTEASVMEDRQHQLDASIVRVMKRLRKATPSTLYAEILNMTKFAFSKQEVSKRVTSLVDREFLERDPGEDGEIRYLA
jgi:cullin-4